MNCNSRTTDDGSSRSAGLCIARDIRQTDSLPRGQEGLQKQIPIALGGSHITRLAPSEPKINRIAAVPLRKLIFVQSQQEDRSKRYRAQSGQRSNSYALFAELGRLRFRIR